MRAFDGDDGRRNVTCMCANDDAIAKMRSAQTCVDALRATRRDETTKRDQRRARSIAERNRRPSDASIMLPSSSRLMSPFSLVAIPA